MKKEIQTISQKPRISNLLLISRNIQKISKNYVQFPAFTDNTK